MFNEWISMTLVFMWGMLFQLKWERKVQGHQLVFYYLTQTTVKLVLISSVCTAGDWFHLMQSGNDDSAVVKY